MYALYHCELLTGYQRHTDMAVLIDQGKVHSLIRASELPPQIKRINLQGHTLSAGFIDMQLNGCGGVMFNQSPTVDTLKHMHQTNLATGTTSFLPTLISDEDTVIREALAATQTYMRQSQHEVLGMHLEGPYTNPVRRGIHPEAQLRRPSPDMIQWLATQSPWLKKITLAPEMNAPEHIQQLCAAGFIVSLGHSAATYEEAMSAFDLGANFVTHLYNAMSPIENGRTPGLVGAVFDRQHVYAGIIADGYHVHWANIRIAKRLLGERLCLVTDATAAATAPADMTTFDFCGTPIEIQQGQCVDQHGTLGGSALTMNEGIRHLTEQAGIHREEAFRMATLYPARALKLDHQLGAIQPGLIANLVVIDHDYRVLNTAVNGKWTKDITAQ